MASTTKASRPRATTAKLEPGQDTIMTATPRTQPNGEVWLTWTYKPLDGSKPIRSTNKGSSVSQVRIRARAKLAELKAGGGAGTWKPSSLLSDYIDQVSRPAMAKAGLAPASVRSYELSLRLILGDCTAHKHNHSLRRHTIGSGSRFRALEDLLTEIAALHGREAARQARTVVTRYVLTRLIRDELIANNPIAGLSLDELTGTRKGPRTRGGKALTRTQYDSVLDYLLGLDPAVGVVRRQGRWPLEQLVAKRRNAIDQALLQAATGLRASEANLATWDEVGVRDDGSLFVKVTKEMAKGGIPRVSLVLDDRVAGRLLERRNAAGGQGYVIGSPTDHMSPWDRDNSNKAARALYLEIAAKVGVDILENERSHVWRTTLHTLYGGSAIPTAVLDSQFGNSEAVRAKHYTDPSDLEALGVAARRLRVV